MTRFQLINRVYHSLQADPRVSTRDVGMTDLQWAEKMIAKHNITNEELSRAASMRAWAGQALNA